MMENFNQKQILIYESINDITPYRNSAFRIGQRPKDRTKSTVSATATASATSTVSSTASAASTGLALERFVSIHVSMELSWSPAKFFRSKKHFEDIVSLMVRYMFHPKGII